MPRLDQLLASLGYGSRREVRAAIDDGKVTVGGGRPTDPGQKVDPGEVRWDGASLDHPGGLLLMLHKPPGVVCSHDPREGANVYGLLPERWRQRNPPVTSVGRLDKETSGLLLLTDQSALVHRLTSPRHKVPKVYRASLDREIPETAVAKWAAGGWLLPGEDEPCAPALLRRIAPREAEVTLTEGRYHQVRRMFAAEGCSVLALHRSDFGPLSLGDLAPGLWRELPLSTFG
jgi:16S rRNA pseudouridine516 synthase